MEGTPEVREVRSGGRLGRRLGGIGRQRRMVAALLAVVGAAALLAAVTLRPEDEPAGSTRTAGSTETDGGGAGTSAEAEEIKPPSTTPGGVGEDPEKTGLPAVPAEGEVRTGTADEGCFDNVREYLEQWHETGVEPDPCFTAQPSSGQEQPDGVKRSYNGERF